MEGNINVGVTPGTHSVTWRKSGSKRLQFFTPAPHHLPPAHPFTGKPNPSASRLGLRPCDCVWPTEQGSGANAQSWGQTLRGLVRFLSRLPPLALPGAGRSRNILLVPARGANPPSAAPQPTSVNEIQKLSERPLLSWWGCWIYSKKWPMPHTGASP